MTLDGCVAMITGAGRGTGRENGCRPPRRARKSSSTTSAAGCRRGREDRGGRVGRRRDQLARRGEADADHDDVADIAGGASLIEQAVDTFGGLDVPVNNAGILRDRFLVNLTEEDWTP